MLKYITLKIRLTGIVLFFCIAKVAAIDIQYGKNNRVTYHLKSGRFDIYQAQHKIFGDAFSQILMADQQIRSTDQFERKYSKSAVKTNFGSGTKHVIALLKAGLPLIKQIFYCYPNREYLMMEVEINGKSVSTNSIVPIAGHYFSPNAKELNSLFVPFDNDAFISYEAKQITSEFQNISAEVGTVYNNQHRNGFVIGSIKQDVWKTGIITEVKKNDIFFTVQCGFTAANLTRDQLQHGNVSGASVKSAPIFVGYVNDWRNGMDDYAKANRISDPPIIKPFTKTTPIGWNSWGVMQEKISFEKITKVADFFADSLKTFRSGNQCFIDLDSYWDNMLSGGLNGDYSKLKAVADYCKRKGLRPGIYWAPFTDWNFKNGPNRKLEDSNFSYGELWTKVGNGFHDFDGARALDPTHPGTKHRIKMVINHLKDCGFEMIKIDFLGHGAAESTHFYDPKITTGMQAYRVGMQYLTQQLDGKMLVYAAISPSLASGRYVHVRRIACDAFKSINDTEYTLNSVTNGWWQTYLYDYIDADHVVLERESEEVNTSRILSAVITGTLILGDDYSKNGQWKQKAMRFFANKELLDVIKDGKAFVPVEGTNGKSASETFVKKQGNTFYIALFNYSNQERKNELRFSRLGLTRKNYLGVDLISKQTKLLTDQAMVSLQPHQSILLKIELNSK